MTSSNSFYVRTVLTDLQDLGINAAALVRGLQYLREMLEVYKYTSAYQVIKLIPEDTSIGIVNDGIVFDTDEEFLWDTLTRRGIKATQNEGQFGDYEVFIPMTKDDAEDARKLQAVRKLLARVNYDINAVSRFD